MSLEAADIRLDRIGVADILSRFQLAVPLNQRAYAWEDGNVEKLFGDLTKAVNDKPVYLLGTIMFTEGAKGRIEVADGQQRLATISILIAAIRDYLLELGDQPGSQQYQLDFLIRYDPPTGQHKPKLQLNVQDNVFFHTNVLLPPCERGETPRKVFESNERISKAAKLAKEHVRDITAALTSNADKAQKLYQWINYLKSSALTIVVTMPSSIGNSFKIFETLNARGAPASQVDILKNFLFERAPAHTPRVQSNWISMLTTVEAQGDDALVLSYVKHLWISKHGPTTSDELGNEIEQKITNEGRALEFANLLDNASHDYMALLTPMHSTRLDGISSGAKKAIEIISNDLRGEQIRPLMLAVLRNFEKSEAEKAFMMCLSWSVRFLIVGGAGGGKLERYYGLRAKDINDKKIKTAEELANDMTEVVPNDKVFEEEFGRASVKKPYLARYYLRAIELYRSQNPRPMLLINEDRTQLTWNIFCLSSLPLTGN